MERRGFFTIALAPLILKIRSLQAQSKPDFHPAAANTQKFQLPFGPVDRHIDALGTESNIHSPADAETYINAISAKYKIPACHPSRIASQ